jgi:hypothetical protein
MGCRQSTAVLAGILCVTAATQSDAAEQRVKRDELPPAVARTVQDLGRSAELRGLSKESEDGSVVYEAEFTVDGRSKDVLIDSGGKVLEVEQETEVDDLPVIVRDGLTALAGSGKIVEVETLTRNDRVFAYEAEVRTGLKKSEIQVGPDGKLLR